LTTAPRIKPTSIFPRSARRPNPGRGSTYRRGIFVQTTGTSSRMRRRDLLIDGAHQTVALDICGGRSLRRSMSWSATRTAPRCAAIRATAVLLRSATM
jgi:hypothetical protein